MLTKTVQVTFLIKVTVDETKFTDEFMEDFRRDFYPFDDIDDHIRHLGQLAVREYMESDNAFIEGYGRVCDMGISTEFEAQEEDIVEE
jgi:hypothetical protein